MLAHICLWCFISGPLGDSPQATDTLYREVLGLTQDKVPNTLQSIHLHCFNGDEATVKLWSDAYPGTYFGFSSMVKGFGERQRRRLKGIPGNRLLLESDSPHLPDVAGSINHPAHLFRVAEEVARVRGQSPLDVLRADSVPELVVRLVQGESWR